MYYELFRWKRLCVIDNMYTLVKNWRTKFSDIWIKNRFLFHLVFYPNIVAMDFANLMNDQLLNMFSEANTCMRDQTKKMGHVISKNVRDYLSYFVLLSTMVIQQTFDFMSDSPKFQIHYSCFHCHTTNILQMKMC